MRRDRNKEDVALCASIGGARCVKGGKEDRRALPTPDYDPVSSHMGFAS